jgi:16S rRNA (uracil1498-N3)-methyltransferase
MTNTMNPPKHRLFIETWAEPITPLSPEQNHYLSHVLRLKVGHEILAFDAHGRAHLACLIHDDNQSLAIKIGPPLPLPEQPLRLHVALPIPKGERADWAVEKLSELGVHEIIWWNAARSVMKEPGTQKQERWKRLTQSAARQSLAGPPPHLSGPHQLDLVLQGAYDARFIALPSASPAPMEISKGKSVLLLIGPDGGFSPAEEENARNAGCQPLWLSTSILRMETAAIVGASHLQNMV